MIREAPYRRSDQGKGAWKASGSLTQRYEFTKRVTRKGGSRSRAAVLYGGEIAPARAQYKYFQASVWRPTLSPVSGPFHVKERSVAPQLDVRPVA